jgi:AAA domain
LREKFSLNLKTATLEKAITLIHGGYASGKTHLLADFLKYYSAQGPVKFVNVIGEDGYLSAQSFGLGDIGETVTTYDDLTACLNDARKEKCVALGVDSMKMASKLAMSHVLGTSDRMPSVGSNGNEWGAVHFAMENITNRMRNAAPFVFCVCPSDKSINQLDGRTYITPDLPGREAAGSAGWFDFVGYLSADVQGKDKVVRKVKFAPNNSILTRQRLPRAIVEDIDIPEGEGGWKRILEKINLSLSGVKLVAGTPSVAKPTEAT